MGSAVDGYKGVYRRLHFARTINSTVQGHVDNSIVPNNIQEGEQVPNVSNMNSKVREVK